MSDFNWETHPRNIANLKKLHPALRKVLTEKVLPELQAKGWHPVVWEGLRTIEEQRQKVKMGYSKTMRSKHLSGRAADIVDARYLWNVSISHQFWKDYGLIAHETGVLTWGGDWGKGYDRYLRGISGKEKFFIDVAHVQLHDDL